MNKQQLVELGLTEEQAQAVVGGYGQMVPKSRLDDKIKELKDAQKVIDERDRQLEELKPKAAGSEALQAEIVKLQEANKTAKEQYESELAETRRTFALDSALKEAKVRNPKAVKALLDLDKVKLNGEALEGLNEQLEAIKQSDAYLFEQEEQQQQGPAFSGGNPTPPSGAISKEQFSKMSIVEKTKLYNENRELYNQLAK